MVAFAQADGSPAALRDAALFRVLALEPRDVRPAQNGAVLHLRRSKTDQAARGASQYIGPPTLAAVRAWQAVRPQLVGRADDARIFPVSANYTRIRINHWADLAGLVGRFSTHSFRIGSTQLLAVRGASLVELQFAGRWSSITMPSHYAQGATSEIGAVARLRYSSHPSVSFTPRPRGVQGPSPWPPLERSSSMGACENDKSFYATVQHHVRSPSIC